MATRAPKKDAPTKTDEARREANLRLWNLARTPPNEALKRVEFGKRKFTSVDFYWLAREMTAEFGPIGKGWGYTKPEFEIPLQDESTLRCSLALWYSDGDERPMIFVTDAITLRDKNGKVDDDAEKKTVTHCQSKALSLLGFGSDVFLGMHEGKYGGMGSDPDDAPDAPAKRETGKREPAKITKEQGTRLWSIFQSRCDKMRVIKDRELRTDILRRLLFSELGLSSSKEIERKVYDDFCKRVDLLVPDDVEVVAPDNVKVFEEGEDPGDAGPFD